MKKIVLAYLVAILSCGVSLAVQTSSADSVSPSSQGSFSEASRSPQVCVFSLTSYSGTINSLGNSGSFKVGLSCAQDVDVNATVTLYIDKEPVSSMVVTIKAGETYSKDEHFKISSSYSGKSYKLDVI